MKNLLSLVFVAFLVSCATSGKVNEVHIGMTKEQVIATMGKPVSVSAKDGTEYLNYKLSETDDDAFRGWTSPYYVRLVNGRVDSYGRTGDFDSTKTPTLKIEKEDSVKVTGDKDLYTELKKLKELRDDGILTEAEYQEKKKSILNEH